MIGRYILKDGEAILEPDLAAWSAWMDEHDDMRRVALTVVGDTKVSTVFLSLDHNFGDGPPLLFETLVLGGPLDGEMDRYSTLDDALVGHERIVTQVENSQGNVRAQ